MKNIINLIVSGQVLTEEVRKEFPRINFCTLEDLLMCGNVNNGQLKALMLFEWPRDTELSNLMKEIAPYHVFVSQRLILQTATQAEFVKRMLPSVFETEKLMEMLTTIERVAYDTQYGDKLNVKDVVVSPTIKEYELIGNARIRLNIKHPQGFKPILSWSTNFIIDREKPIEVWPEFKLEVGVEIQYRLLVIQEGSSETVVSSETYTLDDLKHPIILEESGKRQYVGVSVLAKGEGSIEIGPVHWRYSRLSLGKFILGGNRFSDVNRQEFFYYFNPGDLKPPLNVYFSGYRPAEGFEAFNLMTDLGAPFLLISDPRLEGGSFYLGSEQYEQAIVDVINQYLKFLDFDQRQLILSGLSMGTFGALHYGAKLKPNAMIIGKPLTSIGQVAANIRTIRPNEFETASDVVLELTQGTTEAHVETLNNRFWEVFKAVDFSETKLYVSYMQHDDYDNSAFEDIIHNALDNGLQVVSKGFEGRHNDNTQGVVRWFVYRYREHLAQEFKRDFNGME